MDAAKQSSATDTTTTTPSLRKIEFHLARKPVSFTPTINPNFKLETLNPASNSTLMRYSQSSSSPSSFNLRKADSFDFFEDAVLAFRMPPRRIGAGLENLGNTCFLNSVLQCLTYTEPLVGYLQSGKHQTTCRVAGFCALCAMHKHVSRALQAPGRIVAPKDLVSNLRCISRNFRNARQEDAHEYMIHLLESMHKCCLPSGVPAESQGAYEKSLVHKIFGGRLRSQVKCLQCSHCSDTFDPFLDLSLEIVKADSLYKALRHFTAAEQLDGGEKQYKCERCKQKVRALKQLSVSKAPYVLTIHLKRFRSHFSGQKIDKKVQFGSTLDLKPFVTGDHEGDLTYTLYGVLVHAGWSTHSGHYYSFVRTSSGLWYSLDDNRVYQVSEKIVMEQKAYMLFYVRDRKSFVMKKAMNVMQKENLITTLRNAQSSCSMPMINGASNSNATGAFPATSAVKHFEDSKPSKVLVQPNLSRSLKHQSDGAISIESSVLKSESSLLPNGNVDKMVKGTTDSAEDSHVRNGNESKAAGTSFNSKKLSECEPLVLDDKQLDCPLSIENGVGDTGFDMLKDAKPTTAVVMDIAIQPSSESKPCYSSKSSKSKVKRQRVDRSASLRLLSKQGVVKKISKSRAVGMHFSTRILYGAASRILKKRKNKSKKMKEGKEGKEVAPHDNLPDGEIHASASISVASTSARSSCCVSSSSVPNKTVNNYCFEKGEKDAAKSSVISSTCSLPLVTSDEVLKSRAQLGERLLTSDKQPQETISLEAHCKQLGVSISGNLNCHPQDGVLHETTVDCWGGMESHSEDAKENGSEVTIGHVPDEWDEEYDRGKRKKVREPKNDFDGTNVFQEVATKKAKLKANASQRNFVNKPSRI